MSSYSERKQWFLDRIGKTIYRSKTSCECLVCEGNYKHGIFIDDIHQALYCLDLERDFSSEGDTLKYFDTREEVEEYEKNE